MTVSRPDIALPLDVRGDVILVAPSGRPVTFEASGSRLCLALPGWEELSQLGPRSLLSQHRTVAATLRWLRTTRLSLEVAIAGRPVLNLGHGVRASWLARVIGLGSADLSLAMLIQACAHRFQRRD